MQTFTQKLEHCAYPLAIHDTAGQVAELALDALKLTEQAR
jgi:hypothetical protein